MADNTAEIAVLHVFFFNLLYVQEYTSGNSVKKISF